MRSLLRLGCFVVMGSIVPVACGDDDEGSSTAATAGTTTTTGTTGTTTTGTGTGGDGGGTTTATTTTGTTTTGTGGNGGAGGGGQAATVIPCAGVTPAATVNMVLPDFAPDAATVSVGEVIEFANTDTVPHTSTSGTVQGMTPAPDGNWDTGTVNAGASICVRYDVAGAYPYFCTIHPMMQGTVTVE